MDGVNLFSDVKFVLADCNNPDEVKKQLLEGGAKHINYLSDIVTHVIADRNCPEADEAVELFDKPVVTSLWVNLSLRAKLILPPEAFNPTKRVFHNVVAAFSEDLTQKDTEILAATITFYGGKVSKELSMATHLISTSKPNDSTRSTNSHLKIVAPDWVIDSITQTRSCDEVIYDPALLNGPPPPAPLPPPTPPSTVVQPVGEQIIDVRPAPPKEPQNKDTDPDDSIYRPESHNYQNQLNGTSESPSNPTPLRPTNQPHTTQLKPNDAQYQQLQNTYPKVQTQTGSNSHLPRPRIVANVINRAPPQHRFRSIPLSNTTVPIDQRQPVRMAQQMPRPMTDDQRRANADYNNSYRKIGPYQNGPGVQHLTPGPTYQPGAQIPVAQQQHGLVGQQPVSRLPQPNIFTQQRAPYQGNQMHPRMGSNQPVQQIDPNSQVQQRPYQAYSQQQPPMTNSFTQGVPQRPQTYYNQNPQNQIPMQPQVSIRQPMPQESNIQDGYMHDQIHQGPQQYQSQPSYVSQSHHQSQGPMQQNSQQHPQQQQVGMPQRSQQFAQSQPQPMAQPQQPLLRPNVPSAPQMGLRAPRTVHINQSDSRQLVRHQVAAQNIGSQQVRASRPSLVQPQPHPSIFDNKKETNLAELRAKVPVVDDSIKYFGYSAEYKSPDGLPLAGCRFKMIEYDDVDSEDRTLWSSAILEFGGSIVHDDTDITHLICETRSTKECTQALEKGIRCVTVYWINDVIASNQFSYPWKALHLPSWYHAGDKPLRDQLIAVTNIKGRERRELVEMIVKTGATYTNSFCQKNTLLICGSPGGEKYERAIVWRTPIANCQIIVDYMLGESKDFATLLPLAKYQNFTSTDHLKIESYRCIRDLMAPWTKPISPPPNDQPREKPPSLEVQEDVFLDCKETQSTTASYSQSDDYKLRSSKEPVRVFFTRLDRKLISELSTYAIQLNLGLANSSIDCTHLVVDRISRTPNFICAMNRAKYVLHYKWLIESHSRKAVLEEKAFLIQDPEGEEKFSVNLVRSLLKRKKRGDRLLFQNYIFFVTPSVKAKVADLKLMIESAGGMMVHKKLPTREQLSKIRSTGKIFIVVTNQQDFHLVSAIEASGIDIVGSEFIVSGILRQDIDVETHRLRNREAAGRPIRQTVELVQPSPVKKLRVE